MRVGVRSCVTAGVVVLGASAIAVTPVHPVTSPTATATAQAVRLTAVPSPLQLYQEVFQQSLSNASSVARQYFDDPFPITRAILQNQASAVADAVAALGAGDYDAFVAAATDVVLEPFRGGGAALSHLTALLNQPFAVEGFFLIAVSPVLAGLVATGRAVGEVFEALTKLDVIGATYAVLNIPGRIVDGALNGVQGASVGILEDLPGLLSPLSDDVPPGLIAVGISLDQDMGAAIPPRDTPAQVGDLPDPDAAAITVTAVDTVVGETTGDDIPHDDEATPVDEDTPVDENIATDDADTAESDAAPRTSGKPHRVRGSAIATPQAPDQDTDSDNDAAPADGTGADKDAA